MREACWPAGPGGGGGSGTREGRRRALGGVGGVGGGLDSRARARSRDARRFQERGLICRAASTTGRNFVVCLAESISPWVHPSQGFDSLAPKPYTGEGVGCRAER